MKRLIGLAVAVGVLVGVATSSFAVSTNDQTQGSTALSANAKPVVLIEGYANFSTTAVGGIQTGVNSGAADVYKVIVIPSNCYVQRVAAKMVTLEGATSAVTFTVGDSAGVSQYLTAQAMSNYTCNVSATTSNKMYTSADFISVIPSGAATVGRVKVTAEVRQF